MIICDQRIKKAPLENIKKYLEAGDWKLSKFLFNKNYDIYEKVCYDYAGKKFLS